LRAFVALEIDPPVLDSLVSLQGELVATGADLKPVERENIHYTVKFLGEISQAESAEVDARLRKLSLKGGTVEVRGVGAFPSSTQPSVVWAGVAPKDEPLILPIAQTVLETLQQYGEADRRPFRPHATVARVRSRVRNRSLTDLIASNANRSFGATVLMSLKLKSSVLTPRGPIYSDIGVYPLI
jgi:RNA 2',3'-cyclic 3'-phosphodiesterase